MVLFNRVESAGRDYDGVAVYTGSTGYADTTACTFNFDNDDYCYRCNKCRKCDPNRQRATHTWHTITNTPYTTDIFKDTELLKRKSELIKDMDKFLDNLDSTYKDRDKMRDKVKEFIKDERQHVIKKVTC